MEKLYEITGDVEKIFQKYDLPVDLYCIQYYILEMLWENFTDQEIEMTMQIAENNKGGQ